jgi:hypothetical protein
VGAERVREVRSHAHPSILRRLDQQFGASAAGYRRLRTEALIMPRSRSDGQDVISSLARSRPNTTVLAPKH